MVKRMLVVLAVAGALAATALVLHLRRAQGGFTIAGSGTPDPPAPLTALTDDFSEESLDPNVWTVVQDGEIHDVVAQTDPTHSQLRLGLGTDGTHGEPLKSVEVRTATPLDLTQPHRIDATVQWPTGETGYLVAGVVLSPDPPTSGSMLRAPDWLRAEYVGVPPGGNARAAVYAEKAGSIAWLYKDGWPLPSAAGRTIGAVHLTVVLTSQTVEVDEDGQALLPATPYGLDLGHAYLALFVSSRSGFPAREVRFSSLKIEPASM
jgi:hypothetical protein